MTIDQSTRQLPRRSALEREVAISLAATEYDRVAELFERLTPDQWAAPTDCPGWDVRAEAGHVLGMSQMAAFAFLPPGRRHLLAQHLRD